METIIFIIILLICVAIVGFLFKNIFYIAGTILAIIVIKKLYNVIKKAVNEGSRKINKRKHNKEIEEMKKNVSMNRTTYVDAEVVKNNSLEEGKDENPHYVDVDYKNL